MVNKHVKVLLVEDNPGDARLIQEMLSEADGARFDVSCADRLSTGLELLAAEKVDVVLLDLGLPDSTGLESFTHVYEHTPEIPIVVLTGLDDEALAVKAVREGAQDYLVKGHVDCGILERAIRYALERKQAEEERVGILKKLEAKNRELDNFAHKVSHDLRSPLFSIQGYTTLAREALERGTLEKLAYNLERIEHAALKMDRFLNETLRLARVGKTINQPEDVSFGAIIQEVLEEAAVQLQSKKVTISVAEDFPTVHVDRMSIREVLLNLVENSIKFLGEQPHPEIDIGYRVDGDETVFFVQDNGIGIDPSQHEKVFELFYRLDKKGNGAGAGLAIVKRIIEVHGGRIWIESQTGHGCTIYFTLPLTNSKECCST